MISFDPHLAKKYGMVEAILLERIRIIQENNELNFQLFFDGKHWAELNNRVCKEFLAFIPEADLKFAIENLEKRNVIQAKRNESLEIFSINTMQY